MATTITLFSLFLPYRSTNVKSWYNSTKQYIQGKPGDRAWRDNKLIDNAPVDKLIIEIVNHQDIMKWGTRHLKHKRKGLPS